MTAGKVIVGAAIIADGRVLAGSRTAPPDLAGYWEFPGGKVEPDEPERQALRRECAEELGVEVTVGDRLGDDIDLPGGVWVLKVYLATLVSGRPEARDHGALRWLTAAELDDVPWLPADAPLVDALRALPALTGVPTVADPA